MSTFIDSDDLAPFVTVDPAKMAAMIEDAEAMALLAAPCLSDEENPLTPTQIAAVKAVLRGALIRWAEIGVGGTTTETAGPFGRTVQTQSPRRTLFWPSEIEELQGICGSGSAGAFSIDTAACGTYHLPWCSLMFGALYCSCGADIAGVPIYELD